MISTALASLALLADSATVQRTVDVLPSWRDGGNKSAIIEFVNVVTAVGSSAFVRPVDRIAVFDNDGTLWSEKPLYVQLKFLVDRVHALVDEHPEWRKQQPFAAILTNDRTALGRLSEHEVAALLAATHAGMTPEEFTRTVRDWLAQARHPDYDRNM